MQVARTREVDNILRWTKKIQNSNETHEVYTANLILLLASSHYVTFQASDLMPITSYYRSFIGKAASG